MNIQETRLTAEVSSTSELNKYLQQGWVLILGYVEHAHDRQEPRFVIAWQETSPPVYPELLDEWERREIRRSRSR